MLAALLFVVLAVQLGRPEVGLFAIYLVARAAELYRDDRRLWLSTTALWSTGMGMLLIFARSQSWASAAEVAAVLFGMWVVRVGRRTHPVGMVLVLGLVALVACLPLNEVYWYLLHGGLACLLLRLGWMWIGDFPDAPARMLAEQFDGRFDLETHEIRIAKGGGDFVGRLYPPKCTGPMPQRAVQEGAAVTLRACDCAGCRSFDPKGESQTIRVDLDGHTVTIVHRGLGPLARSVHQGELRALLRQLIAIPHGKAILTGGEMTLRAGAVPSEVRAEGPRATADWSCRTGEQVFRLAFDLYDYLDRSATQAYR